MSRAFKAATREFNKPETHASGDAFEEYTRKVMFPAESYTLVYKTPSYTENDGDFSEATMLPDYRFRCNQTKKEFYVESKWRNGNLFKGKIEVCSYRQLKRYQEVDKHDERVVIALGVGGTPKQPESVFLIPVKDQKYNALFPNTLDSHKFYKNRSVFNSFLWKSIFQSHK